MTRTMFSGFEINDGPAPGLFEAIFSTGASFDTATVRTGTYSLKVALTSGVAGRCALRNPSTTTYSPLGGYWRVYVLVTARPASTARMLCGAIAASNVNIRLNPDGTLGYYNNTTLLATSTTALTDTTMWYQVEARIADGTSVQVLKINGSLEGATASPSGLRLQASFGANDTVADTYTAYFDDVSHDDADFPGPGKVVLLKPTADSAGGTGWTLGTGTALGGNGFGSVDNTPPIGVADLAALSDPKQIRNAASAANSNYDATMTTYTAAGIGASDTVNAISPLVITAAPASTSAKQGTIGVVSNPTIANIALESDGIAGAFWVGSAASTYPTGWKSSRGTLTTSPTVTPGTAPVMRITQVTANTRIAMVCFMGMYVDYTEHRSPPFRSPSVRHNALVR